VAGVCEPQPRMSAAAASRGQLPDRVMRKGRLVLRSEMRYCGASTMRLPPHVHAFVLATAFITSLTFTILAMNVLAGILVWTR